LEDALRPDGLPCGRPRGTLDQYTISGSICNGVALLVFTGAALVLPT
jgi:hypothetical protein